MVSDALHIWCSQGGPHGCSVSASTTALHLVPLVSDSLYPKHLWKTPQCTRARLLGHPVWRKQGEHNPSQPKIAGTTVSVFALLPPPPSQMPVCPCKGLPQHLVPRSIIVMEQRGPHGGPQAEKPSKAAEGAHQQPYAAALPKESTFGTISPQLKRISRG